MLVAELPNAPIPAGCDERTPVVELVTAAGVVKSKGEARRLIQQGGLYMNGERVSAVDGAAGKPLEGGYYWVRSGKKTQFILFPKGAS